MQKKRKNKQIVSSENLLKTFLGDVGVEVKNSIDFDSLFTRLKAAPNSLQLLFVGLCCKIWDARGLTFEIVFFRDDVLSWNRAVSKVCENWIQT